MRRTQIYLDEAQSEALARRAEARGTTASKVIREAIDQYLAEPDDADEPLRRFRAALDATFGAAPYLPDGTTYTEELRRADRDREAELADRAGR